jgi:hypothetical protein
MKFKIKAHGAVQELEGRAAYPFLKEFLQVLGRQIMLPEPPYTTKVRRRAVAAIRRGEPVSEQWDDEAQPSGEYIIRMMRNG